MKKIALVITFIFAAAFFLSGKVVRMPDLLNPNTLLVDTNRLYIAGGTTIYIYSLSDFSLQKKFGREGEGPQEFNERIFTLGVQGDHITINSISKLSYFTKNGNFVKEKQTLPQAMDIKPFKEKFTGREIVIDDKAIYQTINIYDESLTKEKEIVRLEHGSQPGKGIKLFHGTLSAVVIGNKVFSAGMKHFIINVFNEKGEKISIINRQYQRRKVTERDKNKFIEQLQTSPETSEYYEIIKPVIFPAYYPALKELIATDKKLYALTWKTRNGETECYIFDLNGKFQETTYLPLKSTLELYLSPFTIKNGNIYQLVKNESSEKWELHVTAIK